MLIGPVMLLGLLLVLGVAPRAVLGRAVQVSIATDWVHEPVVETAEYLAEQSNDLFTAFQSRLCHLAGDVNASIAVDIAASLLPESQELLLRTAVGMGYYLPKVQFQQAISSKRANPCNGEAFLVLFPGESTFCSWAELTSKLNTTSSLEATLDETDAILFKADHVISSDSSAAPRHRAVLYGLYGTRSFCELYTNVRETSQGVAVSTRYHHSLASNSSFAYLHGYGVYLDIKNMEYKALDDRTEAPVGELEAEEPDDDKTETEETDDSDKKTMEVQKVRDLGLQVVSSVLKETDRLSALEEILYNFPRRASRISKRRVSRSLRISVKDWYQRRLIMSLPQDSVFINGLRIDMGGASFNIYDIFSKLTREMSLLRSLSDLHLPELVRTQILSLAKSMGSSTGSSVQDVARVDVSVGSKGVVVFLNNLEKDSAYKRWPKTVRQLLMPSWSLHAIAKNLYTAVLVIDPLSKKGLQLALTAKAMWQQQYPIRFGFVLYPGDSSERIDTSMVNETSIATRSHICDLFAFAKEYQSTTIALSFLLNLFDEMDPENIRLTTVNDLIQAYAKVRRYFYHNY